MKHSSQSLSKKAMSNWHRVTNPEGQRVWTDGPNAFKTKREVLDFLAAKEKSAFAKPGKPVVPEEITPSVEEPVNA